MIPYIITILLLSCLTYMYFKDNKTVVRFKEENGLKEEAVYDMRFHTSQSLGRWGTKIFDVEAHKSFHKLSNLALGCEVKSSQGNVLWIGDIDLTLNKDKFTELSKKLNKTITVEVDGRVVLKSSDGVTDIWTVEVSDRMEHRNNRLDQILNKK